MTRTAKVIIVSAALAVAGMVVLIVAGPSLQRAIFYPKPKSMPPVVAASTEQLLSRLQSLLETNVPGVARALQPGLTDEEISALEKKGGFKLSADLKALYRWHNGTGANSIDGLIPGHQFVPLERLAGQRSPVGQGAAETAVQQAGSALFAGHRKDWVHVFDDGAGDGYFYDPTRSDTEGAFFFHFAEVGYYVWFPSFRNFLAGAIECYETKGFKQSADGANMEQDFERTDKIWQRMGEPSHR